MKLKTYYEHILENKTELSINEKKAVLRSIYHSSTTASKNEFKANRLKPSQREIFVNKTMGMASAGINGGDLGAIISKDHYILDGHHRWAATMLNNPDSTLSGIYINLSLTKLLPVLNELTDIFNNQRRGKPGKDKNIYEVNSRTAINIAESNNKTEDWLNAMGEDTFIQRFESLQQIKPPKKAPKREEMPVIKAENGEDIKVANIINNNLGE